MRTIHDFPFCVLSTITSLLSERRALNCVWELTYKCNARCSFCSYWDRPLVYEENLCLSDIKIGIRKLYEGGCRIINFSGGEPTLRTDLEEIINSASQMNIWTSIVTNGSLLDQKRIRELRSAGLDNLFISLDYDDASLHDQHRGISGLYERVIKSLEYLRRDFLGGHRTAGLMCVISEKNIEVVERLAMLAKRHGVFITFQPYHAQKAQSPGYAIADPIALSTSLMELKKRYRNIISSTGYLRGFATLHNARGRCHAGHKYFSIDPAGYLHPCVDLPKAGHILTDSLSVMRSAEAQKHINDCSGCWYCFRGEADQALSVKGCIQKFYQFGKIILDH